MDILKLGIDYSKALSLVDEHITDKITRLHLIESEAIMRALARNFKEDEEKWGIVGLLHDIDWDLTKNNTKEHCVKCVQILKDAGATDFLIDTIVSHGWGIEACGAGMDKTRSTKLEHCLVAAETLTGLIIATALMQPDKKLASVRPESLRKKFKTKGFAAKCNRELIMECEKCGLTLDEFLNLGLKALQDISDKLGL
ncbi:MAG: HDIG domain-containing metalloprotein [Patescibacteria group bacterium]|jgi:putative nucleotidyltransferase with HDIG domain